MGPRSQQRHGQGRSHSGGRRRCCQWLGTSSLQCSPSSRRLPASQSVFRQTLLPQRSPSVSFLYSNYFPSHGGKCRRPRLHSPLGSSFRASSVPWRVFSYSAEDRLLPLAIHSFKGILAESDES